MNNQNIIFCPCAFIIVINVAPIVINKAPYIYENIGFSDHCFAFFISERKQYTSINCFNSNCTNIYGVRKGLVSGYQLFLTYIIGLYGQ